jgi:UDP-N-acetylmuramate dehydrogenase
LIALDDIRKSFKGKISINEPLSKYTTFRVGGTADIYLEPNDKEDAIAIISYLQKMKIPRFIMGNGSNILISDEGIQGAVINLEFGFNKINYKPECELITAGAGIKLAQFVDYSISQNKSGVEMLAGIPGTLGGAIIMNAGAYGGEISEYLIDVLAIRDGSLLTIPKNEAGFEYRNSALQNDVVLEATFKLPEGIKEDLKISRRETMLKRNNSQPVQLPNAGSIFKNPKGTFAAKLIEECGLKGLKIGGAEVSALHANFIVNINNAKANDILLLAEEVRTRVFNKTGIMLEYEIKLLGFDVIKN